MFFLNNLIADELGLQKGLRGLVAYDEDTKEWYISFGDNLLGFSLRVLSNKNYKPRLCFAGKEAALSILNDVNATHGATFVISKRPKVIDGQNWYRIMTKKPKRIN